MRIKDLTMSFGTQILFQDVNLNIKENEKIGIVGVNGAGKSTFLKLVLGHLLPDEGKIILKKDTRIALLPQVISDEVPSMDISVFSYLLEGRPIAQLETELQEVYDRLSTEGDEKKIKALLNRVTDIQTRLEYFDVYSADSILLKIIDGMKISDELLDKPLKALSGGQKSKIAFARLLYSKPDLILLDEPTNHLDKDTKDFVINYLKSYKGTIFVISHDIDFLNQVTTQTLFIDKRTKSMTLYDGNYDIFKKLNDEHEKALRNKASKQEQEEKKLRSIIDKYASSSGKRKKMAQDREKKLQRLLENKITLAPELKTAKIAMPMNRESNVIPLKVDNLFFKYNPNDEHYIIQDLSFSLDRGEKFLIVGENGIGKSTLLKLITGMLKPTRGTIEVGNKTDIGYYAQEHELLDEEKDVLSNFSNLNIPQRQLRNVLGRFLFYGDDVFKNIQVLSPGERSRVALAKLSLLGANLLILDEPTNHLDPETQKIIADTFSEFEGTMLVVSHNPEFVDNLGIDRMLVLPSGQITYYNREIVEHFEETNTVQDESKKK